DLTVTGVQTCALPISTDSDVHTWFEATSTLELEASELRDELRAIRIELAAWPRQLTKGHRDRQIRAGQVEQRSSIIRAFDLMLRSEERRVGKEWRFRV